MYHEIEEKPHMTDIEASERYPDSFIIMRMDSMDISNQMGRVLYIGNNQSELISLIMEFEDLSNCGVVEGLNLQRSLGGVVVGG